MLDSRVASTLALANDKCRLVFLASCLPFECIVLMMKKHWQLWSVLCLGTLAVFVVIGAYWRGDNSRREIAKESLPIRKWLRVKEVSTDEYSGVLEGIRRDQLMGTVILPRVPDVPGPVVAKRSQDVGIVPPHVCGQCHAEQWSDFQQSPHLLTSREPSHESTLAKYQPPDNRVKTFHPHAWFEVIAKPSGFFQQLHIEYQGQSYLHEARMDLVLGSGKVGQSFLSWTKDALHQLPVSYFTDGARWGHSPGSDFAGDNFNYARPITERCLDCHATWFERVPQTLNRFSRDDFQLGVTCSRCHGSGREHVEYHQAHPNETDPHAIANPAKLRRDLAVAVCAQCHSSEAELVSTGFRYQPGEPLAEYLVQAGADTEVENSIPDPHAANQQRRLENSACFRQSDMTCFTCHDPHRNERGREKLWVERCLKCHEPEDCHQRKLTGEAVDRLCIECHMPLVEYADIRRPGQDSMPIPKMRDHRIQVWPETTANVLQRLSKSQSEASKVEVKSGRPR